MRTGRVSGGCMLLIGAQEILAHMPNRELADFAVKHALRLGATYAEARWEREASNGFSLKNGVPQLAGFEEVEGIGLRLFYHGGVEYLSTDFMDRAHITELVERGIRSANANARLVKEPVLLSHEGAHRKSYGVKEKRKIANVDVDEKFEVLSDAEKAVKASKIPAQSRYFSLGDSVDERYFVNSEGAKISSVIPRVYFSFIITVGNGGQTMQRHFQLCQTGGYERLKEWKVEERVVGEGSALLRMMKEGVAAPEGPVDVVCAPEVVGIACHESVGHPYEADRILGREGAQAGESFLTPEDIGMRIGSESVSVADDPTLEGSAGYFLYDDEGVQAGRKMLMTNGVVTEFLHNRETAYRMGMNSNGSARAMDYESEAIVRMSNTFLLPGEFGDEELFEGVKKGVFIKSFMEWNIDDKRMNQKYVSSEAYLIEKGRITKPVKRAVLETTTRDFWSSIDAVGKKTEHFAGTCGKGEPMQGVPVWMGGPAARLKGIRLGV